MGAFVLSHSPSDEWSGWFQICTTINVTAAARTSNPCPRQHQAARSALSLLHRNCPLSQTPLLTGLSSQATSTFLLSSPGLPLSGWPSQSQRPSEPRGGLADSWDAEARAPETPIIPKLDYCHGSWGGNEGKTSENMPGSHFDCDEGTNKQTKTTQAIDLWMYPRCFHPPPPEQRWQGHQPQI